MRHVRVIRRTRRTLSATAHVGVVVAVGLTSLAVGLGSATPALADTSTSASTTSAATSAATAFSSADACQPYTVPMNVNQIDVTLVGGAGFPGSGPGSPGGRGGSVTTRLDVESNSVLYAVVGSNGGGTGQENKGGGARHHGGAGGDGLKGYGLWNAVAYGGGGGGASFLSTDGASCGTTGDAVNGSAVLAVAGGGGGGGAQDSSHDNGGAGGDAGEAGSTTRSCTIFGCYGGGRGGGAGTGVTGGSGGMAYDSGNGGWLGNARSGSGVNWLYTVGGNSLVDASFGGAGGGGWYGGGQGGDQNDSYGGGGGGSNYVRTVAASAGSAPTFGVNTSGAAPTIVITPAPTRRLTVGIGTSGTGSGTVNVSRSGSASSSPSSPCAATCTSYEPTNGTVTLTANTPGGMRFVGWTGGSCGGTSPTCTLTMDMARTVTATFNRLHRLTFSSQNSAPAGDGTMTVSPPGLPCGTGCYDYDQGSTVTLTASPDSSSVFLGWRDGRDGGCRGTSASCTVTLTDRDLTEYSNFRSNVLGIQKDGAGSGTVTGSVDGVPCGTDCSGRYPDGATVTLTATPAAGSTAQWQSYPCYDGGATPQCVVTMHGSTTMHAGFIKNTERLWVGTSGGYGGVQSDLGGISCSSATGGCGGTGSIYEQFTTVTLTAIPQTGSAHSNSVFTGWSGACTNVTGPCVVGMNQTQSVTANFSPIARYDLTVDRAGGGNGSVTSDNGTIACGNTCIDRGIYTGTRITLTATPDPSTSVFTGWQGPCSDTSATCTVAVSAATTVHATFALLKEHLTVATGGTGSGTVTSHFESVGRNAEDVSLDCGTSCDADYNIGDQVLLTPNPAANTTFTGWSGDCIGTTWCRVTMDQARSVTATFTRNVRTLSVSTSGAGGGTVSSAPTGVDGTAINCGTGATTCSEDYDFLTPVTLTATPRTADSHFTGWSGACTNTTGPCTLQISDAASVAANFELNHLTVRRAGGGTGSVASSDSAISCGAGCEHDYPTGTVVTLTATPSSGSTFTGWSAPCANAGTGTCSMPVSGAASVTATFTTTPSVTVVRAGTSATGTVTDTTGAVNCGPATTSCSYTFPIGHAVTLTAQAASGTSTTFDGWTGACSGAGASCTFTPTDAVIVTATFTRHTNPLSVTTAGTGNGIVTSSRPGLSCVTDSGCSGTFGVDDVVNLTATPAAGSTFTGWSGDCSTTNTDAGTCSIAGLSAARAVTATFTAKPTYPLTVGTAGTGHATLTTDVGGIDCGTTCSATYQTGTLVWITATVGAGTTFDGWGDTACIALQGADGSRCKIQVNGAQTVTASLVVPTTYLSVSSAGTGTGTVTSSTGGSPADIACSSTCGASFPTGSNVTLTATPDSGSSFSGWNRGPCTDGASSAPNVCVVPMNQLQQVITTFTHAPLRMQVNADGGRGTGAVAISGSANCTFECAGYYAYRSGSSVMLTATPDANMRFVGWSACPGQAGANMCVLTPWENDLTATAVFAPISRTVRLALAANDRGTGTGAVAISSTTGVVFCTASCTAPAYQADTVRMTATDGATGTFDHWTAADCGTNPVCTQTVGTADLYGRVLFDSAPILLSVANGGTGSGTITSDVGGISCGSTCATSAPYGSFVRLYAHPAANSTFIGWTGDCAGQTGSCLVAATVAKTVTATFALLPQTLTVSTAGSGSGSVTSDAGGIDCGSTCTASVAVPKDVVLTATPDAAGSTFAGWSGDCSDAGPTCTVRMDQARTVVATFTLVPRNLTITPAGTGTGSVSSAPSGIDCGTTCSAPFDHGTTVTLSAHPSAGSTFTGWTGDCSGTADCTVDMTTARAVGPSFALLPLYTLRVAAAGAGSGTVTAADRTISCGKAGTSCTHSYPGDAAVTLTATPTDGASTFTGWTGACTGTGTCTVALSADRMVTATFAVVTIPTRTTLALSTGLRTYGGLSSATITATGGTTPLTGLAQLKDGTVLLATVTLRNGVLTVPLPKTLAVGRHNLTASYLASGRVLGSVSAVTLLTVTQAPAAVSATVAATTVTAATNVRMTVAVTSAGLVPAGKVSVADGTRVIATGSLVNGKVVVTLPRLARGRHTLTATYTGSTTIAVARSRPLTLTVR